MAPHEPTLTSACFILAYTGLVFGQQMPPSDHKNGDLIHTPQDKVKDNSTTFDIDELERRIIQKVTKDLEARFQTCKALETGLGLEMRLEALEHTVAGLVNTSCVTGDPQGGLSKANVTNPSTAAIRCPPGFTEFESHCYIFNMAKATWKLARQNCLAQNSDLVSINTPDEQRFLVDIINKHYSTGGGSNYWIGLMDTPDGRIWVDGSPTVYEEWGEPSEPNCMKKSYCKPFMSGIYAFRWEDAKNTYKNFAICEIAMTKS